MKLLIVIAVVAAALYLGVNVSMKGSTACVGLSDHRACGTGSAK